MFALDAVVASKSADDGIRNRELATERAIDPVVSELFPGMEIEVVPRLRFEFTILGILDGNEFCLFRMRFGEALQPVGLASAEESAAEGLSKFFAASSTNSIWSSETFAAHQSTADRMVS